MENIVWIPGATFLMGSDKHYPEEPPAHTVPVDSFWMDRCAITNDDLSATPLLSAKPNA